jgi:DNA-binding transcriptional MocR family regulator
VLSVSDLEAKGGRDADLAYLRVADDIAARIASGELVPGARLRGERDLATYYEVSYGTVRRAMEVLRERGLIETIHGRGTFVRKYQGRSLPTRCGDRRCSRCSSLIMPNTCRNRPEHQHRRPHWRRSANC